MQRLLLLNIVGLTSRLIGTHTPNLAAFAGQGTLRRLNNVVPAVTCSVQASMLTGLLPEQHGIVGNGWLFRELAEVSFWRQSNRLVSGERLWEAAKRHDPDFRCANLFWWYNMASSHDFGATPRPIYKADGRKLPDCHTKPAEWRDRLTTELGAFPLFRFWGPATSIESSRWIAEASKLAIADFHPGLLLSYLPHLDYDLQRYGPDLQHPAVQQSLRDIDAVAGSLIAHAREQGYRVMVVSEYGITPVSRAVHLNRHLREAGLLQVRHEAGAEILDPSQCQAFAVADHQIAHVYLQSGLGTRKAAEVEQLLRQVPGVAGVWQGRARSELGLNHERAGDFVVLAEDDAWFSYYYWLDDARAPDFARTVDIHRKPGYDPAELFIDPEIRFPRLAVASRLGRRALGMRSLMDVIGLDASIVKGSHGLVARDSEDAPLLISDCDLACEGELSVTDIKSLALQAMFGVDAIRTDLRVGGLVAG
ncbi:nucleotide pyrophosphatase/phosphodiesterase family protein [Jeongeupia naejangsanensis]|uniref:Alkaline phosphatase family protein n=1 Tax=Jeongeupia naejangsanensis TaxID=613195 RepID=A0ABS2BGX5_9NEIS|nr:nucleotide pyrophosphatase/phosphodiesterase family protein [Jeongeupia naejangsanensis]MBM3114866.1 alkaline phosphatase family protein [Jeongeupia naejangsanensis]